MKAQLTVLGVGAGRCGSKSLAALLNSQPDFTATHQSFPLVRWKWEPSEKDIQQIEARLSRLGRQCKSSGFADIAPSYLPYLEPLLRRLPELLVIALRREKDAFIQSFKRQLESYNPFLNHWFESPWKGTQFPRPQMSIVFSNAFPKYDMQAIDDALGQYWDDYNLKVAALTSNFPGRILNVSTEDLSSLPTQREILEFCGFPSEQHRLHDWRENTSQGVSGLATYRLNLPIQDVSNCVVLVPYFESILPECDESLRQLEVEGYRVMRCCVGYEIYPQLNKAILLALEAGAWEILLVPSDCRFKSSLVTQLRKNCNDFTIVSASAKGATNKKIHDGIHFSHIRRQVFEKLFIEKELPILHASSGYFVPFFNEEVKKVDDAEYHVSAIQCFEEATADIGFPAVRLVSDELSFAESYSYSWEDAGVPHG